MQTAGKLQSLRAQLSKDANRLRQESNADYENKLYQAGQKHKKELEAVKQELGAAKSQRAQPSLNSDESLVASLEALKSEHASTVEVIRRESKENLEAQLRRLNEDVKNKAEAVRKDLNDKHNREKTEFYRKIAEAQKAQEVATQSLEKSKRESEESQKQQSQRHLKLKEELEAKVSSLTETHRDEQDRSRQRAIKAEKELRKLQKSIELSQPQSYAKSQVSFAASQANHTSQEPASTPFKVPKRKVVNRNHSLNSATGRPGSAFIGDIEDVENVPPKTIRTFAEVNALLSDNQPLTVFQDSSSSGLTDPPAASPSPFDPRVLRERRLDTNSQHGSEHSSQAGGSQSIDNPFALASSRSHARPNTATRLTPLPDRRPFSMTPKLTSVPARDSGSSHRVSLISPQTVIPNSQEESKQMSTSDSVSQIGLTSSRHFETPKTQNSTRLPGKDKLQSSSPGFIDEAQVASKMTTYGHKTSHNEQWAPEQANSSAIKRRRDPHPVPYLESNKRGRYEAAISLVESQSIFSRTGSQSQSQGDLMLFSQSESHGPVQFNSQSQSHQTQASVVPDSQPPISRDQPHTQSQAPAQPLARIFSADRNLRNTAARSSRTAAPVVPPHRPAVRKSVGVKRGARTSGNKCEYINHLGMH